MEAIEIQGLSKQFKGICLFQDTDFHVEEATITGLTGPNGSGKSVLFKMICGFLHIDAGSISVFGKQIGRDTDIPENTGVIIETPGFLEHCTHIENLKYLASIRNIINENDIRNVLERVGLNPENRQKVRRFSLGMRQKLAIAQAIMENPKLLILDEPCNGLDTESVNEIRKILLELRNQGTTILMASHIQEDITLLCDNVYRIEKGKINPLSSADSLTQSVR